MRRVQVNQPLGATTMTGRKATAVTVDQRTDTYLPNRGIPLGTDRWSNCGVMAGLTHAARPLGLAHVIGVISARLVPDDGSSCGTRSTAATRSMWRTAGGPLAVQESVDSRPRCRGGFCAEPFEQLADLGLTKLASKDGARRRSPRPDPAATGPMPAARRNRGSAGARSAPRTVHPAGTRPPIVRAHPNHARTLNIHWASHICGSTGQDHPYRQLPATLVHM